MAAGGAVLAHVCGLGLGLGVANAYAAANEPLADTVRAVDVAGATGPGGVVAAVGAGGAGGAGGGAVDQLLQSRIRAGGLPLPGQATAVPDAFAIATVLLPAVPAQPRPQGESRPPGGGAAGDRSAPSVDGGALPVEPTSHEGVPAGVGRVGATPAGHLEGSAVDGGSGGGMSGIALAARAVELAASRDSGRAFVGAPRVGSAGGAGRAVLSQRGGDPAGGGARVVAGGPLAATGSEGAVLIPIAAGLLLTGAAMYKHRGLPRGH